VKSKISFRAELPQWLLIVGMFLASAIVWPLANDHIPVHWNIAGQIDRYGSKWEGLLMAPVMALGIYFLCVLLPRIDPGRANYEKFQSVYRLIRFTLLGVLAVVHGMMIAVALGYPADVKRIVLFSVAAMLLVLGNSMGKIRPNWFVGIRTPWTLSSKLSWTRTHRWGGWLMVVLGLLAVVAAMVPGALGVGILIGTSVVGFLGLVVYSYLIWRRDPDRVPPAGTTPSDRPAR
jgi:uncharacterized membrane protein